MCALGPTALGLISSPLIRTSPPSGSSNPAIIEIAVVLPAPLGPSNP